MLIKVITFTIKFKIFDFNYPNIPFCNFQNSVSEKIWCCLTFVCIYIYIYICMHAVESAFSCADCLYIIFHHISVAYIFCQCRYRDGKVCKKASGSHSKNLQCDIRGHFNPIALIIIVRMVDKDKSFRTLMVLLMTRRWWSKLQIYCPWRYM